MCEHLALYAAIKGYRGHDAHTVAVSAARDVGEALLCSLFALYCSLFLSLVTFSLVYIYYRRIKNLIACMPWMLCDPLLLP